MAREYFPNLNSKTFDSKQLKIGYFESETYTSFRLLVSGLTSVTNPYSSSSHDEKSRVYRPNFLLPARESICDVCTADVQYTNTISVLG